MTQPPSGQPEQQGAPIENPSPGEAAAPVEFTGQTEQPKPGTEKDKEKPKGDPRQGLPTNVVVEEASAPMDLDRTVREDPKNQYIQYNGVGTVRIMAAEDWKRVGVDSQQYCEWNYFNKKRLPRSSFSDAELQYLLRQDDRFALVTIEPEKESDTTE